MRTLVWFRSDLRTLDNAALHHASREATKGVLALFVIAPGQWRRHDYAPHRVDLILRSLRELSGALARLNIPLLVREAPAPSDVPHVVLATMRQHACDALYFNKEYELDEARRDDQTLALAKADARSARAFTDQSLLEPGDVRTSEGRFFTVFSPFKRAAYKLLESRGGVREWPLPKKQPAMVAPADAVPSDLPGFEAPPAPADTDATTHVHTATPWPPTVWPAGEAHALARMRQFASRSIIPYKDRRDFPGIDATSMLSPYLAVGCVSPRQLVSAAVQANASATKPGQSPLDSGAPGVAHWISEVLWREFYIHILVGFPRVCMGRAFQPATERVRWNHNPAHQRAWEQGRTGVPIVDAAMRQLARHAWMHNRLRMIVAMYFTKNLFLDWRLGERFFMRSLVDGFLASNNGGWQWSASTGTDAAPYFRIFNPVSQSQKFDPDGSFIRAMLPELRDVEGDAIHEPWTLPSLLRARLDYPEPLVDLSATRTRAIEAFREIKGASTPATMQELAE
jgi:deoxyribodipyrimidine photo-lyase